MDGCTYVDNDVPVELGSRIVVKKDNIRHQRPIGIRQSRRGDSRDARCVGEDPFALSCDVVFWYRYVCRSTHNGHMAADKKFDVQAIAKSGLNRALESQYPVAVANVERLRRVHPEKSPAELISFLNKVYLGAVTTTGAGAGAAAIVPNAWLQVPVAVADLLTFLETSVLYTLSVAEIYGVDAEDVERRRFLVLAALLGNSAMNAAVDPLLARTTPYWSKKIVQAIPISSIKAANKVLGPNFITKYGTRQGILVLGKQVPLFIGVGIGAGGNHLFGRFVIKAVRKNLGTPPTSWESVEPEDLIVVDDSIED